MFIVYCCYCYNCNFFIYHPFNISSPTSLKKKFSPFPLPFRKYIVTLPHAGLRHEEQAILMRAILKWQTSPFASPLPANKNQAETAKCTCTPLRCATMICFWIKNYCCPKKILSFTCLFHEKQLPLWRKQTPHYPPTLNPAALWQRNISTPKQT